MYITDNAYTRLLLRNYLEKQAFIKKLATGMFQCVNANSMRSDQALIRIMHNMISNIFEKDSDIRFARDYTDIVFSNIGKDCYLPSIEAFAEEVKEFPRLSVKKQEVPEGTLIPSFYNFTEMGTIGYPGFIRLTQPINFYNTETDETLDRAYMKEVDRICDGIYGKILVIGIGNGFLPYYLSGLDGITAVTVQDVDLELVAQFKNMMKLCHRKCVVEITDWKEHITGDFDGIVYNRCGATPDLKTLLHGEVLKTTYRNRKYKCFNENIVLYKYAQEVRNLASNILNNSNLPCSEATENITKDIKIISTDESDKVFGDVRTVLLPAALEYVFQNGKFE